MENVAEVNVEVDHELQCVRTTWQGVLNMSAIAESCQQRIEKGGHKYVQLVDATHAEVARSVRDSRVVGVVTGRMADESQKFGMAGATATVVKDPVDYGMCRVIASYFEPAGMIRVFYDLREAREWLANTQVAE